MDAQTESTNAVDNQAADELQASKFTWTIENFSKLNTEKLYSDVFVIGSSKWRVLIFPKGNHVDYLSIYLDVADSSTLPSGWSRHAKFGMAVVNQNHPKYTLKKVTQHQFHAKESDWGFTSFMPLDELYNPNRGFLLNDTCIIEADVAVRKESFAAPREPSNVRRDVEMETKRSGELGTENFLEQVQEIDQQNDRLNTLLHKLQTANEESRSVTKAASMKAIKQKMEKDVDEVNRIAHIIKSKIEALDRENMANRQKPGCGCGTAVDRSRTATTGFLRKKFKDKITEFQNLRQTIQQEYREVVERRVFTVTGKKADDQTIDRLIETGDSEQIFQKTIQEQGRDQIIGTVAEMQERRDAVMEIERKLLELQQIFLDMAVLVDSQGDMLDNITHVSNVVDQVQFGNKALLKAKVLLQNTRKWMCIRIHIPLVVIVVVVGMLLTWKSY